MKRNIIIISVLLLHFSCNTTEKKNVSNTAIIKNSSQKSTENVVETFDDFYKKFYSDSAFQFSRIEFPLKGNDSNYENMETDRMKEFENDTVLIRNNNLFWKKTGWHFLKTLKNQGDFGYSKKIEKSKDIVKEVIYMEGTGDMDIRHFKQKNGKWLLIYYASVMY